MKFLFLALALIFLWVGLTVLYWPPLAVVIVSSVLVSIGVGLDNE